MLDRHWIKPWEKNSVTNAPLPFLRGGMWQHKGTSVAGGASDHSNGILGLGVCVPKEQH